MCSWDSRYIFRNYRRVFLPLLSGYLASTSVIIFFEMCNISVLWTRVNVLVQYIFILWIVYLYMYMAKCLELYVVDL